MGDMFYVACLLQEDACDLCHVRVMYVMVAGLKQQFECHIGFQIILFPWY